MEKSVEQLRERNPQFSFEIDEKLNAEVEDVLAQVPGLKKAILGRAALSEKVREIKQKLENGETVTVTV